MWRHKFSAYPAEKKLQKNRFSTGQFLVNLQLLLYYVIENQLVMCLITLIELEHPSFPGQEPFGPGGEKSAFNVHMYRYSVTLFPGPSYRSIPVGNHPHIVG